MSVVESAALLGIPRSPTPPTPSPSLTPVDESHSNEYAGAYDGICGCCKWFLSGDLLTKKKFVFMGWIVCALLSIICFWFFLDQEGEDVNTGFILCCSLVILMSIFATVNFCDVLRLRDQVGELVDQTKQLADSRDKVRNEVERLGNAQQKFGDMEGTLGDSTKTLRENFTKFQDWDKVINKQIKHESEEANVIRKEFRIAIKQYHRLLKANEIAMLDKAYRQVENKDGQKGLSKEEFDDLLLALPARYKLRFDEIGKTFFEEFAGGDDIIDHREFSGFMEEMADREARCGLDLEEYGIVDKTKHDQDDEDEDGKDDEKGA